MAKPLVTRQLHIFGDESSHTGQHKFLVYGTMSCDAKHLDSILAYLERAAGGSTELKWRNQTPRNKRKYQKYVTAIYELVRRQKNLWFRCVVIDTDETLYKDNLALGLKSYIFLNLITYARAHAKVPATFTVLLDDPGNLPLESLRTNLNNRDADEHGRNVPVFTSIDAADSKASRLVQAADIITGAVAYVWNKHHEEPQASYRKDLASHIAFCAQIPVIDKTAMRAGIKPGDIRTLGLETAHFIAQKGLVIWPVDWKHEQVAKLKAESKAQLLALPQHATYGELMDKGYSFAMMCPRCGLSCRRFL